MAPTVKKPVDPAAAAVKKLAGATKDGKAKKNRPRNYDLGNGIYRFSRTRMYHKKAIWKFKHKKVVPAKKPAKPSTVEKQIGGDKNGKTRTVLIHKRRSNYPIVDKKAKKKSGKPFKLHKRSLRTSLTPGTVCIVLAGAHKGKRVVLLKQLSSGLLLITGPFKINACPMRRISQRYVIGTATKLDISGVKLADDLNDDYFRREKKKRAKKEEGDIFSTKKESYHVSEKRKADQKVMDKSIIDLIKKRPDKKLLFAYLATMWGLRSSQFPHRMKF